MPAISRVTPANQTIYWDRSGTVPAVNQILVTINEPPEPTVEFVQFYIERISGNIDWLDSSKVGEYLNVGGDTIPLAFKNLDKLYPGNYQTKIDVFIDGAEGNIRHLTAYVNLNISGEPPVAITTDKPNYNVIYRRDTNTFFGETEVNIINNSALDPISMDTIGTLLKEATFTDTFNLEEDPAFPFSTNTELPLSGTKVVNCRLKKDGIFVYAFTVTITVIESDEIIAFPNSFEFLLRKGYNETKTADLVITNPLNHAFTITKPSWLNLSANSGSASATINLETANSDTLTVGEYLENITISYDSRTITIPVKLTVISFVDINLSEYNFCLDNIILKANKMNEAAKFVQITLKMKFDTASGLNDSETKYQIPYFQDKIKTDIGEKMQNYFPVFQDHLFDTDSASFDNQFILKPVSVEILVEEIDINYVVLLSKTFTDLDFYPGNRPKQFPLFTNYPIRRKYSGSTYFFSYFSDLVIPDDFTGVATAGNPATAKQVHSVKMIDGNILHEASLKTNLDVEFLPFPYEQKQVVLQWLPNTLVPDWLMLSGKYKLNDDFEQIYDDFQINGQKYETTEKQKLTISTGFVLKEETKLIKEIIKSKISYILLEAEVYKAICVSTKLVELDSEETMKEYELEFIIVK